MEPSPDQTLQIADGGDILTLTHAEALDFHGGESWFGVAVGFRMLQAVAPALSTTDRSWNRDDLYVVSGHPGDGVRDVIEYVTHCVSRDRYRITNDRGEPGCSRGMEFNWEVGDGGRVAVASLREGFVPEELDELLERHGTSREMAEDAGRFAQIKRGLARQVWDEPLERLFEVRVLVREATGHA